MEHHREISNADWKVDSGTACIDLGDDEFGICEDFT